MRILFLIPARGGSKGLPGKNVATVGGIPLVGRAARRCRDAAALLGHEARIVCSTDDATIAAAAAEWGAEVLDRPAELATDAATTAPVVLHALDTLEVPVDLIVLVQTTSPLASAEDIAGCVRTYVQTGGPEVVAVRSTPHAAWTFEDRDGRLHPALDAAGALRRQDVSLLGLNGACYVLAPDRLRETGRFLTPGEARPYVMPAARSLDVDDAADLAACRAMIATPTSIELAGRRIGPGERVFVIAEAGVNHNGDLDLARQLIDAAHDAGADAVKFQTFDPDLLVAPTAPTAEYQKQAGETGSQREMLERLVLPLQAHAQLRDYATGRGILFLSSPFDHQAIDDLVALGVAALKIPSGELTNHPMLAHAARTGLPLLVSTGMSRLSEVAAAVDVIRTHGDPPLALFHCVSSYPASPDQCNLAAIETLRDAFGVPAGWSDHTQGIAMTLAAVARGASLVEKHLTTDNTLPGPDHAASLEPDIFAEMVRGIRDVRAAIGDGVKQPTDPEHDVAAVARKSWHWTRDLTTGHLVTADDVRALRPGTGISPARDLVGARLTRDVARHAMVDQQDLAP